MCMVYDKISLRNKIIIEKIGSNSLKARIIEQVGKFCNYKVAFFSIAIFSSKKNVLLNTSHQPVNRGRGRLPAVHDGGRPPATVWPKDYIRCGRPASSFLSMNCRETLLFMVPWSSRYRCFPCPLASSASPSPWPPYTSGTKQSSR